MFRYLPSIVAAAFTFGVAGAHAGDLPADAGSSFMNFCRYDYHRVCSYVVPGDGRAARCLLDHEVDLSPRCLKAVKIAFALQACLPDYDRYCRGVPAGPEALACLSSRLDFLHPECHRIVAANEPYMRDDRGERYGYHYDPYGAPGSLPAPGVPPYGYEGRAPYGEVYPGAGPYGPREGDNSDAPRYQPYGAYPYPVPPRDYGRYAEGTPPQADPNDGGEEQRFQPYGERYPSGGYEGQGYGAPQQPYSGGEDREPPR